MDWTDIACIVFSCVTANHLGLVSKIEEIYGESLPVVNCPKCFSFWSVMAYGMVYCFSNGDISPIMVLAISFLSAYFALWLELFMGYIDYLYSRIYDTIYGTQDNTPAANPDEGNSAGSVS